MRSIYRDGYYLHAPVTAIAPGLQWICFAIGNRVLAGDINCPAVTVGGGNDTDLQLVAELPYGAVVTALEQHVMHNTMNSYTEVVVVIGSGDCVFVAPLQQKKPYVYNRPMSLAVDNFARIMRIRSLGPGMGVLVLTAINSAYVVYDKSLTMTDMSTRTPTLLRYCVVGLGVALAADAVMEAGNKSIAVFSGTYDGSIAAWRLPIVDTPENGQGEKDNAMCGALSVVSRINAHRPGCAVFAVKVICAKSGGTAGGMSFYVATCSDDRTATLYISSSPTNTLTEGLVWTCCWRGTGASFSRRRVFDVSIQFFAEKDDGVLLLATGSEDGSVHVFAFRSQQLLTAAAIVNLTEREEVLSSVPVKILHRRHEHDGRGVYKLALMMGNYNTTNTTMIMNSAAVVSFGFDGSVHYTPLSSSCSRRATLVPCGEKRKRHVRGVVCDDEGMMLACTEDELFVFSVCPETRERRFPIPIADIKKDLPSCIGVMTADSPSHQPSSLALVGTTGGNVYGIWYKVLSTRWKEKQRTENAQEANDSVIKLVNASSLSLTSSALRVFFVRGTLWKEYVLIVSVHPNGVFTLSALDHRLETPAVVWAKGQHTGVHTTTLLEICIIGHEQNSQQGEEGQRLCVFMGDDNGGLSFDIVDLRNDEHKVTTLLRQERFFQQSIASVVRETTHMTGATERFTVVSAQGEWRVFLFDVATQRIDIRFVSRPLRLPWRISVVLAYSDTVAVTLLGTDISVYTRRPSCFSWQLVAEYHDVKAPRLLTATIPDAATSFSGPYAFVCHCSDGVQAEWFICSALTETRICHGGAIIGREYNTAVFLPSPALSFVCGSENSMLTLMPLPQCTVGGIDAPLTLAGPHDSNILATAVCERNLDGDKVCFVTVGGLATLALWEWSAHHGFRVVAHVEHRLRQGFVGKGDNNNNNNSTGGGGGGGGSSEVCGVPRFLSVCVTLEDVVAGGSDGIVRVFSLNDTLELRLATPLSTCTPKPILSMATLSVSQRLVVAGDTNGVVFVFNLGEETVTTNLSWSKVAVNAIAVGREVHQKERTEEGSRISAAAVSVWRVLAAMDSGDVLLLHVGLSSITVMCTVCVGLTAVRGVCWITGQQDKNDIAAAVNDERVTCLKLCDLVGEPGQMEKLHVVCHTRVNIRGVSDLAVAVTTTMSPSVVAVVVGEGIESLPLLVDSDISRMAGGGRRGSEKEGGDWRPTSK